MMARMGTAAGAGLMAEMKALSSETKGSRDQYQGH